MLEKNNEIDAEDITEIRISVKALTKIFSYTRAVSSEIGGLLLVDNECSGLPIIKDALLFKQTVSGAGMELDAEDLSKQIQKIAIARPSKINQLKGWWHSHADFGTFWSGTDDECFENFLGTSPVTYGIVVNRKGSIKARVDMQTEVGIIKIKNINIVPDIGPSKRKYMEEAWRKVEKEPEVVPVPIESTGPRYYEYYPSSAQQWAERLKKEEDEDENFSRQADRYI